MANGQFPNPRGVQVRRIPGGWEGSCGHSLKVVNGGAWHPYFPGSLSLSEGAEHGSAPHLLPVRSKMGKVVGSRRIQDSQELSRVREDATYR